MRLRWYLFLWMVTSLLALSAAPVGAQEERNVMIEFETGDYDADRGDWPITVVNVSGELFVGELFVVELRSGDGAVLWTGEAEFAPPTTSVAVDRFVAVGDVDEAAIGQRMPETPLPPAEPAGPAEPVAPVVAGDVVTVPAPLEPPGEPEEAAEPLTEPLAEPAEAPSPVSTPTVQGDVSTRDDADPLQQGNGFGGAGQLALSMVIAVIFVAILFRTPLPAATTTRWRK